MKKLFSLFVPLMALFLTLSPQTAKAAPVDPASTTTATPFTIYHTGSESGYNGRFEIKYDGNWSGATKPILQYRILYYSGSQYQGWTDISVSSSNMKMTTTKCTSGNTYFVFANPTASTSYPSGWAIQFRLKSGQTWNVNKTHWITFKFRYQSANTAIGFTGNIMSLVSNDFENVTEIPSVECFYKLFSDDTGSANNVNIQCNNLLLPATTLKDNCYENMFSECASFLKTGPNIMAFNPESDCASAAFKNMFNGCSGMTTLTTNFMTWGSGSGTENWLNGCSACKTVNCPSGLDVSTKDASHIGTAYTSGSGNVSPSVYVFNVSENSGTWNGTCQADKYYTTAAPTVPDPNEDGFAGWYTASTGGSAVTPGSLSAPSTVTKYYAQFSSATTFNVAIASYNSDNGTVTVAWNDGSAQTLTSGNTDILNATTLTITAVPNAGYKLTGLTITPSGGVASNFTSGNTHTLSADITVTATFEAKSFTLAVNETDHGTITADPATYAQDGVVRAITVGTTVNFTAVPAEHYVLSEWTGALSGNSLNNSLTVGAGMDEALTVGATFALEQFTINATSANLSMGSVTGGGTFSYGAAVTLTATANDGYRFVEWSDGNTGNPRNFTASENLNLTATFGLESVDQTVKVYQNTTADTTKILYALTPKTVGGITYTPIDLGYGVAWADKNMGATDLKPAGNYYAWGNLSSGTSFNANTYYNGSTGTAQGFANGTALPNDHDAANQTIGSYWHIPSPAQWSDLLTNCSVSSYTYTGANGNSITLPATGYYNTNGSSTTSLTNTTHYYYWTNTKGFYSSTTGNNSGIIFEDGAINGNGVWEYDGRLGNGLAIRPIYQPTFTIYTLTINVGSYKYVYKCQSGQSITVNVCATELGATFNEWSEDHNTNASRTFTVTADATYTATFTQATTYAITFVDEDGSTVLDGPKDVVEGVVPTYNGETPTKEATAQYTYTFNGWSPALYAADKAQTYTATYTRTPVNYTLAWVTDGDELTGDYTAGTIAYGTTIIAPNDPIKDATAQYTYTFNGWEPALDATMPDKDVTYTATWTETKRQYTLTWDVNGGNALTGTYTNGTIDWGTDIVKPANPTRTDYTFGGWDANNDGKADEVAETMPTTSLTYKAIWVAELPNITLCENCDNDHYNTFKSDYDKKTVNVTYPRQFSASKWSTMCLPFSIELPEMIAQKMYGRVYEFKYATGNANTNSGVNLYFSNAKKIEAGKCYIVNANDALAAKTSFVFSGVTIDLSKDNGADLSSPETPEASVAAYNALPGYKSEGTIELVGTLRNGILMGTATGNRYMGLKDNKIYYPNISQGSTIWAYRGIFRSKETLNIEKMRIIVDGEDRGEIIIDADGDVRAPSDAPSRKFIRDGVLYIEREGVVYDAQGKRVESSF